MSQNTDNDNGGNQGKLTSIHFFFPFHTSLTPPKAMETSSPLPLAVARPVDHADTWSVLPQWYPGERYARQAGHEERHNHAWTNWAAWSYTYTPPEDSPRAASSQMGSESARATPASTASGSSLIRYMKRNSEVRLSKEKILTCLHCLGQPHKSGKCNARLQCSTCHAPGHIAINCWQAVPLTRTIPKLRAGQTGSETSSQPKPFAVTQKPNQVMTPRQLRGLTDTVADLTSTKPDVDVIINDLALAHANRLRAEAAAKKADLRVRQKEAKKADEPIPEEEEEQLIKK
ncbi:hypothetical protein PG984_016443 [Apiospora sp. TS-2023a]